MLCINSRQNRLSKTKWDTKLFLAILVVRVAGKEHISKYFRIFSPIVFRLVSEIIAFTWVRCWLHVENWLKNKTVFAVFPSRCTIDDRLPVFLRTINCNLLLHLHLDREPQEQYQPIQYARIWWDMDQVDDNGQRYVLCQTLHFYVLSVAPAERNCCPLSSMSFCLLICICLYVTWWRTPDSVRQKTRKKEDSRATFQTVRDFIDDYLTRIFSGSGQLANAEQGEFTYEVCGSLLVEQSLCVSTNSVYSLLEFS